MQLNNIYLKPNELSIHSFANGFSFSTFSEVHFYEINDKKKSSNEFLEWLNKKKLIIKKSSLLYFSYPPAIIPEILFDEKKAKYYLESSIKLEDKVIKYDLIPKTNQAVVYYENDGNVKLLNQFFPAIKSKHFVTFLIEELSYRSNGKLKKQLYINLRKDYFEVFLFQSSQLLLFNTYNHKNEDDFLYFLLYITEIHHLDSKEFTITFLGKYSIFNNYYKSTNDYHSDSNFLISSCNKKKIESHQSPFFCNLFK